MSSASKSPAKSFTPSPQQDAFAAVPITRKSLVIVRAFAGAGKTTTLELLARRNPTKRFLYLVFGNKNAKEAKERMPSNVDPSTVHALALAQYGERYRAAGKLDPTKHEVKTMDVVKRFNCSAVDAAAALAMVAKHLNTTEWAMTEDLIPSDWKGSGWSRKQLVMLAERVLSAMQNLNDVEFQATHDLYLKEWVMSKPLLKDYDCIIVDEAQDSNPLTLALIMHHYDSGTAGLVLVGDSHQNIYAFRNTVNALEELRPRQTHEFALTESYRYPPKIGKMATAILRHLKGEKRQVVGKAPAPPETWMEDAFAAAKAEREKPEAIRDRKKLEGPKACMLSRTNATLIRMAIAMLDSKPDAKFHFAGTNKRDNWSPRKGYKFAEMEDACALALADPKKPAPEMHTKLLKPFKRWAQFKEFAASTGDNEANMLIRLVESIKPENLPAKLRQIEDASGHDKLFMTLATAHKSKGLEWDRVKILSDFQNIFAKKDEMGRHELEQEANLLYVAVTRAKKELVVCQKGINDWLEANAA